METVAVCLYSKYSQRCREFLENAAGGVHTLCVDHPDVRQAIAEDSHGYNIKTVPCVFLFYPDGRLEKYEGSDAFTWLRKVREVLEQQQQQPPPPPQTTPLQPFHEPQPQLQEQLLRQVDVQPQEQEHETVLDTDTGRPQNAEDIINQEMELRRASEQIITRKQDNIKELAQMMQRQRESDDDQIQPPALYPKDRLGQ